ncbi:MAG TPA: hypothetical protein DEP24_00910 [Mycobacterium sp.]|nr:hypothetical protein [Mycobacterium sp.]
MKYVYLAGPILGCTKGEANDWRKYVDDRVSKRLDITMPPEMDCWVRSKIRGISPLRCEPIVGEVYTAIYDDPKFGTAKAIGVKNLYDTKAADIVLAYLPKPAAGKERSLGTVLEIGWAKAIGKPVIIVTDDPFVQGHPVVQFCADWMLDDLDQAVDVIVGLLAGYEGGKNL